MYLLHKKSAPWLGIEPSPMLHMNQSLELIDSILCRSRAQNLLKWWLAMMLVWRISHGSRWWFLLCDKWGLSLYLLRYLHTHSCLAIILGRNIEWHLYLSSYTAMLLMHTALFIHMPVHRVWFFPSLPVSHLHYFSVHGIQRKSISCARFLSILNCHNTCRIVAISSVTWIAWTYFCSHYYNLACKELNGSHQWDLFGLEEQHLTQY